MMLHDDEKTCAHGETGPHEIVGLYEPGKPAHHGHRPVRCAGPKVEPEYRPAPFADLDEASLRVLRDALELYLLEIGPYGHENVTIVDRRRALLLAADVGGLVRAFEEVV
jgi:hypothetical protein